jgi:hypothetical protein
MKTAARQKGARPLTHNIYELCIGERVKVLTSVTGASREGVWIDSVIVAKRELTKNSPKVLMRAYELEGEVKEMPSSCIVVDTLYDAKKEKTAKPKKLKKSSAYLLCVHDWQVVPLKFWGKKGARSIVETRHCRRRKAGLSGVASVNGRVVKMLSQDSNGERTRVAPRPYVLMKKRPGELFDD